MLRPALEIFEIRSKPRQSPEEVYPNSFVTSEKEKKTPFQKIPISWRFCFNLCFFGLKHLEMDGSNNRATPKWMVHNGKPY